MPRPESATRGLIPFRADHLTEENKGYSLKCHTYPKYIQALQDEAIKKGWSRSRMIHQILEERYGLSCALDEFDKQFRVD